MSGTPGTSLPQAVIRTDASVSGGLGHFMRCRALAGEWMARGGLVTFVTTRTPEHLLETLWKDGCEVKVGPSESSEAELSWIHRWLKALPHPVLFLDGYEFGLEYQRRLRSWVHCLVCLDDVPGRPLACDVVLNQNLGVTVQDYELPVASGTTVLLGPRYASIRGEYRSHAGAYRVSTRPSRILVTMGGADQADNTIRVLSELAVIPDVEIELVLGSLYQHPEPIGRVPGLDASRVRVHRRLDGLLGPARRADLTVTAAGSTVWELACLGMPMAVVGTADNQDRVLQGLRKEDAAIVLGRAESIPAGMIKEAVGSLLEAPFRLEELSRSAARLVDGRGTGRVVEAVRGVWAGTERCETVGAEPERGAV